MSVFSWGVSNTAQSTTADSMTLTPAASRVVWVIEVSVGGMGTSSVAGEMDVYGDSATGTTGTNPVTAAKFSPWSNTAGSVVDTTWATQPTVLAAAIRLPVNANGGIYRWVARPGEELVAQGGAGSAINVGVSFRGAVSTNTITLHTVAVEDPY
jgi:hypothetical protein